MKLPKRVDQRVGCPACLAVFSASARVCPADAIDLEPLESDPMQGFRLDDRYELLECIGETALGRVFRARDVDRLIECEAIVAFGEIGTIPELADQLEEAAEAVSMLDHDHIASPIAVGRTDTGLLYVVTEHVGRTRLSERLSNGVAMEPELALRIAGQLTAAIAHAHGCGVAHGALDAGDVVLDDDDDASITGIGLQPDAAEDSDRFVRDVQALDALVERVRAASSRSAPDAKTRVFAKLDPRDERAEDPRDERAEDAPHAGRANGADHAEHMESNMSWAKTAVATLVIALAAYGVYALVVAGQAPIEAPLQSKLAETVAADASVAPPVADTSVEATAPDHDELADEPETDTEPETNTGRERTRGGSAYARSHESPPPPDQGHEPGQELAIHTASVPTPPRGDPNKRITALYVRVGKKIHRMGNSADPAAAARYRDVYRRLPFQDALRKPAVYADVEAKLERLERDISLAGY